jgi:hypothetical protein
MLRPRPLRGWRSGNAGLWRYRRTVRRVKPNLVRDGVQRPALPMGAPDLLVVSDPLGSPSGGEGRCPRGGRRGRGGGLGVDTRQLLGVGPEHIGPHVREVLQQVEPIRHLEGLGCPEARRFRIGLGPIPHEHLDPGMCLKPLGDSDSLPIGQDGQGTPPGKVQQERAIGVTLPQGEIIHAEDPRGADHRAGGAADRPQEGVPTDGEAERPTQSHPSRPTQGEADGQEMCHQSQRPPRPRHHDPGQSFREDAAGACRTAAEELTDAELPRDPVATPREIGQCPSVMTVDVPSWDIAPWASRRCLGRRDQEGDLGVCLVNLPGVKSERCGFGQQRDNRVSNLLGA